MKYLKLYEDIDFGDIEDVDDIGDHGKCACIIISSNFDDLYVGYINNDGYFRLPHQNFNYDIRYLIDVDEDIDIYHSNIRYGIDDDYLTYDDLLYLCDIVIVMGRDMSKDEIIDNIDDLKCNDYNESKLIKKITKR